MSDWIDVYSCVHVKLSLIRHYCYSKFQSSHVKLSWRYDRSWSKREKKSKCAYTSQFREERALIILAYLWQLSEDNHNVQFVGYSSNKCPLFTAPPPHQNDTWVSFRSGMNHVKEFCSDAVARPGSSHSKEQVVVVGTPGERISWTALILVIIIILSLIIILIITTNLHPIINIIFTVINM